MPDWQQRGFVPDHVRNPQRYTVYVLDEPLSVGGGEGRWQRGREREPMLRWGGGRGQGMEVEEEEEEEEEGGRRAQRREGLSALLGGSRAHPHPGPGEDRSVVGAAAAASATLAAAGAQVGAGGSPAGEDEGDAIPATSAPLHLGVGPGAVQFRRRGGDALSSAAAAAGTSSFGATSNRKDQATSGIRGGVGARGVALVVGEEVVEGDVEMAGEQQGAVAQGKVGAGGGGGRRHFRVRRPQGEGEQ